MRSATISWNHWRLSAGTFQPAGLASRTTPNLLPGSQRDASDDVGPFCGRTANPPCGTVLLLPGASTERLGVALSEKTATGTSMLFVTEQVPLG